MLRATLDQMRASAGRLAAAGIAILLGTAFVAASLLASATMEQATHDAFTASYADADLVVTARSAPLTSSTLADIRAVDGVKGADIESYFGLEIAGADAAEYVGLAPTPSDPALAVGTLAEGVEATAPGQLVLSADVAERLGVDIGDTVSTSFDVWENNQITDSRTEQLRVVGLLEATGNYFSTGSGGRLEAGQYDEWRIAASGTDDVWGALIAFEDGADAAAVRASIEALPSIADASVQTLPELAEERTAAETGSNVTFLVVMLAFASVALAVAGLVITNTFQVLVAQRTRTLALLRCVGASRAQIRASVLGEAALLGVIASVVGLALGTGIVLGGVKVLENLFPGALLGTTVPFSWYVPVVTLIVGIVVTVLAALVPARMATQVAPVAALRPIEGAVDERSGRGRLVLAITASVLGALMLAGGVALALALSETDSSDVGMLGGLALGVLGGLISLCGLLIGSVFLIPKLLPVLGRLAGKGTPARIATANAVRNPRRTAATTNALVIGVALVVMMSTGAYSARQTLLTELDSSFPVDLAAGVSDTSQEVTQAQVDAVRQTDGVAAVATLRTSSADLTLADGYRTGVTVNSVAEGDPDAVMRSDVLADLDDDTILLGSLFDVTLEDGDTVTLTSADGTERDLTLVQADVGRYAAFVTPEVFAALAPDAPVTTIWAQMEDDADAIAVSDALQAALNDLTAADPEAPVLQVGGSAIERAAYGQVIDTLLAVVLGLLGVAVVIALVGVANTLSLSVLERRRENATLRAMGLTRGQLRGMLAVEGVLIATVGAAVGAIAGLLYGWAGAAVVLGGLGSLELGVPWLQLGAVAVIAVTAGLLASVLPARSAVRQSPVAALATD